jgi:hypothetical protein
MCTVYKTVESLYFFLIICDSVFFLYVWNATYACMTCVSEIIRLIGNINYHNLLNHGVTGKDIKAFLCIHRVRFLYISQRIHKRIHIPGDTIICMVAA